MVSSAGGNSFEAAPCTEMFFPAFCLPIKNVSNLKEAKGDMM